MKLSQKRRRSYTPHKSVIDDDDDDDVDDNDVVSAYDDDGDDYDDDDDDDDDHVTIENKTAKIVVRDELLNELDERTTERQILLEVAFNR